MLYRTYRYSRWDGTQEIFGLDAEQLMDRLSEEVLKQGDVMRALRELLRQGYQNRDGQHMTGLGDLLEQLKYRRRQQPTTVQHGRGSGRPTGAAGGYYPHRAGGYRPSAGRGTAAGCRR